MNNEGQGGRYLEKGKQIGGEEKQRRKRRTIFGEGKYLFAEEKKRKENI